MAQYIYTMNRVGKIVPPKRHILRDISLSFFPGAKIGVLGLNGSGKSTFFKILAGYYKPHAGEIRLDGVPVSDRTRDDYRGLISAIFPDFHLFHKLYGIPDPDMIW